MDIKNSEGAVLATVAGTTLAGADLSGLDLTDAQLQGQSLVGTKLVGTNLTGANLTGVQWVSHQILTNADGSWSTSISSVADLTNANLTNAQLNGYAVTDTRFGSVAFFRTDLGGVILDGANCTGANLNYVSFYDRVYYGGSMQSKDFDARVSNTNFSHASLRFSVLLPFSTGIADDFSYSDLTDSYVPYVVRQYGNLTGANTFGVTWVS